MRFVFLIAIALPLAAFAQNAAAPMLVVGEGVAKATGYVSPEAALVGFPKEAITSVGIASGALAEDAAAPKPAPAPEAPAAPTSPSASTPQNPAAPTPPTNPTSKLWPRDTFAIFLPPCTGLRPQFLTPCTCIITKLMATMGHDEFLKKSEDGSIEQDPRLQQIRTDCATAPRKKE